MIPCAECGAAPSRVGGDRIYPHRPDLYSKSFWLCACGAYVGCHPGSDQPLGSPAGPRTRDARQRAHRAFDPLWRRKAERTGIGRSRCRADGYRWPASRLGIPFEECHIGMMDAETALRVVELCRVHHGEEL